MSTGFGRWSWNPAPIAGRFRLEVIEGAGHGFTAGLVELGRRVAAFLPGMDEGR